MVTAKLQLEMWQLMQLTSNLSAAGRYLELIVATYQTLTQDWAEKTAPTSLNKPSDKIQESNFDIQYCYNEGYDEQTSDFDRAAGQ